MKGFKKVDKGLKSEGFVVVKNGSHVIYSKDGQTVCVTRNVKNADKLLKKALSQWRQQVIMNS